MKKKLRICCVRIYPAVPKDVFFSPYRYKYLKADFLTFLEIATYCTRLCAICINALKNGGHRAR